MLFEYVDDDGVRYVPRKYNQSYHTVEPRWLKRESARFSEANSEDVLLDHLRRGFHLWMTTSDGKDTKLVAPEYITARFDPD